MTSVQLLVAGGLLVVAALYFVAVRAARRRAWSARVLIGLSVLSGLVLLAMVLTDWPGEQLNQFWADHSIFASVLSTVLLVSLGYLAFEARETAEQADLNRSVTSAGLSGLVDHLVDVDIALSMLASETAPEQMYAEGRPLQMDSVHSGGTSRRIDCIQSGSDAAVLTFRRSPRRWKRRHGGPT